MKVDVRINGSKEDMLFLFGLKCFSFLVTESQHPPQKTNVWCYEEIPSGEGKYVTVLQEASSIGKAMVGHPEITASEHSPGSTEGGRV